jgi:hypothetical protein
MLRPKAGIGVASANASTFANVQGTSVQNEPRPAFRMKGALMTPPLPNRLRAFSYSRRGATWRSGYATVCKTVYPGSIPGVASTRIRARAESPP